MFTRGYPIYFPKPGILLNGSQVDLAGPTASEFKPLKPSKRGVSKTNYAHVSGECDIVKPWKPWMFGKPIFQQSHRIRFVFSPPARWGLLDFMSVACSSPPLLSSSSCSTATLDAQCSLSDLNHDHPRPVFPAGPQPRPSPPSVPCRTSTTTIHAQCSLPDLNREYPRQVFPAGPHVGRYGTKNVQKKVRKNVRQVCYILLANSRVCGRVTGAMPLLTLQVAKFEAISLMRWQSHWGGQRHFHFCTFGAVCKDAWDRQHLTASYYKLLEVISCWIDAWDSQHHTGFLLCITAMVAWWICDIGTFVGAFEPSSEGLEQSLPEHLSPHCWSIWALIWAFEKQWM